MSANVEFNHNMFSKHLNDAYFEIIEQYREDPNIRCRVETNVDDETVSVRVYVIKNNKIIKIITFKEGKTYYKSTEGGNRNGN